MPEQSICEAHAHSYQRVVELKGKINLEMAARVTVELVKLEDEDKSKPIALAINSGGGQAFAAKQIMDIIGVFGVPIYGVVVGPAHSGAFHILQKCKKRFMLNHEEVTLMFHQPRAKIADLVKLGVSMESLNNGFFLMADSKSDQSAYYHHHGRIVGDNFISDTDDMYENMLSLTANRSGQSINNLREWGKEERIFDSQSALELNLVDELFDKFLIVR